MDHDIFADRAGWGNYPRLTCLVCNETVLKKPYMTAEQWERVASDFKKKHEAAQPAGEAVCTCETFVPWDEETNPLLCAICGKSRR